MVTQHDCCLLFVNDWWWLFGGLLGCRNYANLGTVLKDEGTYISFHIWKRWQGRKTHRNSTRIHGDSPHLTSIEPCLQRVFQQCNISQCCLGLGLKLMTVIISLFFRLGCSDSSPPENLACRGLFDGLKLTTTIISLFLSLCLGLNLPSNGNFWIPYEKNISSTLAIHITCTLFGVCWPFPKF